MKFVIDTDVIAQEGYAIGDFLMLLALYYECPITKATYLRNYEKGNIDCLKGFDLEGNLIEPKCNENTMEVIERIILNSEIQEKNAAGEDRYLSLAKKMIELYPKGKKPGTNHQWRDSAAIISKKLKGLVKRYNCKFTDEQAIEATTRYIQSFNGDYTYMQLLKYFISKRVIIGGEVEENSQLLAFIENPEEAASKAQNWNDQLV
jgi:hypothetical protein